MAKNDPYIYKNTNVLINKFATENQDELDQLESTFFQLAFTKLISDGFNVKSSNDIFLLHKLLFSEVYSWAGEVRTINIYKEERVLHGLSVNYSDKNVIKNDIKQCNSIVNLAQDEHYLTSLTRLLASLWQAHPFREGNTRTIVVFLYFLLKQSNIELNIDFLESNAKYFRNALVLASLGEYSEFEHLERILGDAISLQNTISKRTNEHSIKYNKIKDLDLKDYKYNYHQKK